MEHSVPHDVGRDLAKKATIAAMDSYAKKYGEYGPRTTWTGDYTANVAVHIKGVSLDGKIDVRDREIGLSLDIPFIFRPFRARALAIIDREINEWMARAKAGEFN
jgi:hypothetical protein